LHPIHAEFTEDSSIICQGKRVIFTDGSTGTGKSYLWSFGDGSFSSVSNPVHNYPHEGVYKVFEVVTDFVPCTDTAFTTISVDTISPIHMGITDTVICRGTYVTFTGNYSTIGNTGITWTMGNGEIFQNLNPLVYAYQTTGTYTVTAAVTYRVCPDTEVSRKITIIPAPEVNLGPDTSICKGGQPILLVDEINKNTRGASWEWSTGQTGPAISVYEPGTYSVVVKIEGCPATYTVKVDNDCYINIPNVFTPNGDGINDYFFPRNLLTSGLISFKMDIYNRWGQLVFESTSTDGRGWDGKLNNADQPEGVYVYVIDATFKDGQAEHHQGNITLIR
jgi:gliding motility-associated-like protein